MSGDPLSTLGPSDSGFLNSFLTPAPSKPLRSRVGEDPPRDKTADNGEPLAAEAGPLEAELAESVLDESVLDDSETGFSGLSDEKLAEMILAVPLPDGLVNRLRNRFESEAAQDRPSDG
ncbi:MAG: hypothetical protein AAF596_03350 [Planctomycetota bacterium]